MMMMMMIMINIPQCTASLADPGLHRLFLCCRERAWPLYGHWSARIATTAAIVFVIKKPFRTGIWNYDNFIAPIKISRSDKENVSCGNHALYWQRRRDKNTFFKNNWKNFRPSSLEMTQHVTQLKAQISQTFPGNGNWRGCKYRLKH